MNVDYSACRILVADDEPVVAQALAAEVQHRLHCPVTIVHDGDQVLDALTRQPFDILVTDMIMPGCHGLELVSRVVRYYPETDVLVTTAFPEDFPFVEVVRAGACDFVAKPHQPEELQAKLMRIIRERALMRELAREKKQVEEDMESMRRLRDERIVAETKYRNLFEHSVNGMLVVSPETHLIRDVNYAFCTICGYGHDTLIDKPFLELFDEVEKERLRQGLAIVTDLGRATLSDIMLRSKDGTSVCLEVSITRIQMEPEEFIHIVCQDVTEQREMQRRLAEIAQTDQLTGLFNKRSFRSRVEAAVLRARKEHQPLTVLLMDLDNFKQCHDTHGPQVADDLLRSLGAAILKHVRAKVDAAFRHGNNEFAILLCQADTNTGNHVVDRIREEFSARNTYGTSLSVGITPYAEGQSPSELLKAAEEALYQARLAG